MAEKKITLSDVAKVANVSVATASMAFSGKGRVSEEVINKVLGIAKELGYKSKTPSPATARANIKCISLLLLTDKKWAYLWYMEQRIVRELELLFAEQGYILILIPITEEDSDERIIEKVLASGSSGVLSIHYGNPELFKHFEKLKLPVTLIMNSDYQGDIHSVCVDDFQGAHSATKHLLGLGHTDIAFVEYKDSPVRSIMMDRNIGYEKALIENGITPNPDWHIFLDVQSKHDIEESIERVFSSPNRPSAIFAVDDYIAMHFLPVLNRLGISVPEDISIISPGDVMDYDVPFMPRITTMSINFEQMAKLGVEMQMSLLNNKDNQVPSLKVELKLLERGSTGIKK